MKPLARRLGAFVDPRDASSGAKREGLVLAAIFAVLGFLVVTALGAAGDAKRAEAPRRAELVELIQERRRNVSALSEEVALLRRHAAGTVTADGVDGGAALGLGAGAQAVHGPGLLIVLDDAPQKIAAADDDGTYRINDTDLQLVANALWASGAEAMAVNGSRLVATSPIRGAGDTLVVNFRPMSPPYRVEAVGADRSEFAASDIAGRFAGWQKQFGLRFEVSAKKDLSVPAYSGRLGIRSARPIGEG